MGLSTSTGGALIKRMYSKDPLVNSAMRKSPLFAKIAKFEGLGGESYTQPIVYGNPASRKVSFADAQTAAASTSVKSSAYVIDYVDDYAVATITGSFIRRTKNDLQAFAKGAKTEIDGARDQLTMSLCQQLYGNGYGRVGVIHASANLASTTLLLSRAEDVNHFQIDAEVVFAAAETSGALRTATALTVTALDRDAGTLTLSATPDSLAASIAVADSIFIKGDRHATAASKLRITGLEGWIPNTAALAGAALFGVTPTDLVRQRGNRWTPSNLSPIDVLTELTERVYRNNGECTDVLVNPTFKRNLLKDLGNNVRRDSEQVTQSISHQYVEIIGASGPVKVWSDPFCPSNRVFGVNFGSFMLGSVGPAITMIEEDGNPMLRQAALDGFETRLVFSGNMIVKKPVDFISVAV